MTSIRNVMALFRLELRRALSSETTDIAVASVLALAIGYALAYLIRPLVDDNWVGRTLVARTNLGFVGTLAAFYYGAEGVSADIRDGRLMDLLMAPISRSQYLAAKTARVCLMVGVVYLLTLAGLAVGMLTVAGFSAPTVARAVAALLVPLPGYWTLVMLLFAGSTWFRQRLNALLGFAYVLGLGFAGQYVLTSYPDAPLTTVSLSVLNPTPFLDLGAAAIVGEFDPLLMVHGSALLITFYLVAMWRLNALEIRQPRG